MPHILVSGIGDLIDPVADSLRTHGSTVVVVGEVAEVAAAATEPARARSTATSSAAGSACSGTPRWTGSTTRGARLMARYPACPPRCRRGSGSGSPSCQRCYRRGGTDDDVEARAALLRCCPGGRGGRTGGSAGAVPRLGRTPDEIAVSVLGSAQQEEKVPVEPDRPTPTGGRLLGMMSAHGIGPRVFRADGPTVPSAWKGATGPRSTVALPGPGSRAGRRLVPQEAGSRPGTARGRHRLQRPGRAARRVVGASRTCSSRSSTSRGAAWWRHRRVVVEPSVNSLGFTVVVRATSLRSHPCSPAAQRGRQPPRGQAEV